MPDIVTCGWPADGHPPPMDEPASYTSEHDHPCQAVASGWFASPKPQTEPIIDVCIEHAVEAERRGWSVTDGEGTLFAQRLVPRTPSPEPLPETVQFRAQRGDPDAVRRMDIYEQLAGVEDTRPCMWPVDGSTPDLTEVRNYIGCGAFPCRHRALSPDGHVLLLRLPVCDTCADLAEAAGWTFGPLGPTSVARAEPERAIPVEQPPHPRHMAEPDQVIHLHFEGDEDPEEVGRRLADEVERVLHERAERVLGQARQQLPTRRGHLRASVDAMADLGDGRGLRPVTMRRATDEEAAAFNRLSGAETVDFNRVYDGVKAFRESLRPEAPPVDGERYQAWPRGIVAPVVAAAIIGTAVALAAAGELAEAWRRRHDAR